MAFAEHLENLGLEEALEAISRWPSDGTNTRVNWGWIRSR